MENQLRKTPNTLTHCERAGPSGLRASRGLDNINPKLSAKHVFTVREGYMGAPEGPQTGSKTAKNGLFGP